MSNIIKLKYADADQLAKMICNDKILRKDFSVHNNDRPKAKDFWEKTKEPMPSLQTKVKLFINYF